MTPNALNRDDTVHGTYYYLASEADKIIDELRAENERLTVGWNAANVDVLHHAMTIAAQRKVLERALEALKAPFGYLSTKIDKQAAITAIHEQLKGT